MFSNRWAGQAIRPATTSSGGGVTRTAPQPLAVGGLFGLDYTPYASGSASVKAEQAREHLGEVEIDGLVEGEIPATVVLQ